MKLSLFLSSLVASLFLLGTPSEASAQTQTELSFDVSPTPTGIGYNYNFTLVAGSGQTTLGWLIFGDVGLTVPSTMEPLGTGSNGADGVALTSPAPGPWTGLTVSSGPHAGPTFDIATATWTPTGPGDSLSWSVTAPNLVSASNLCWSNLIGTPLHDCGPVIQTSIDNDGDGQDSLADCDDYDPNNFRANPEVCDGQDKD